MILETFDQRKPYRQMVIKKGDDISSLERRNNVTGPSECENRDTIGRHGTLIVRFAQNTADIQAAQRLRYTVFYEEMSAIADGHTKQTALDEDKYDDICDHLLVCDESQYDVTIKGPMVVGTYRLLSQDNIDASLSFYSANEFDIEKLLSLHHDKKFLELGRSCVLPAYRSKKTVELLWHGIWSYVLDHKYDVMLGCASFNTIDPETVSSELSYLYHYHRPPPEWCAPALCGLGIVMNRQSIETLDSHHIQRLLPPLIKGYLRLGCYIAPEAIIDSSFATIDVFVVLPVSKISLKYINYYGAGATRYRE